MSSPTPPGGYPTHQLNTLFLRVPISDWNLVRIGEKREFRTKPRGGAAIGKVKCPTPVVAYTVNTNGVRACKLMVLANQHHEHLIDIADNGFSLQAEGFKTYNEFKRYWRKRNGGIYKPLQEVLVHTLRPWSNAELTFMSEILLRRLYTEFMPPTDFTEYVTG
jgi:hypothetical protein